MTQNVQNTPTAKAKQTGLAWIIEGGLGIVNGRSLATKTRFPVSPFRDSKTQERRQTGRRT